MQANPLIVDHAIAFAVTESVHQLLRGRQHIVNQTNLTQVEAACQMKAEKLILKFLGCQF